MKKLVLIMFLLVSIMMVGSQPVFAVGEIIGPDIIYKDSNEIVSINDITSLYTSTEAVVIADDDGFTGNGHLVGDHQVILKATDGLLDKFKTITIKVTYNKIPDVEGVNLFRLIGKYNQSNSFIFVTLQDKTVTLENIRDTLINLNQLSIVEPSSKSITSDLYTANKTMPGKYTFNFKILDATGVIRTINSDIKVVAASDDWVPLEPIEPGPGIIDINFDFIAAIFSWILAAAVFVVIIGLMVYSYKKFTKGVKRS